MELMNNPIVESPDQPYSISFAQTRNTLIDTDIYSRFVISCMNNFKRLRFYKSYKAELMRLGIVMDQRMPALTSEMVTIEMHHNLPTLKQATIMIIEHLLNHIGRCTTFDVVQLLEDAHRKNWIDVIMLSKTQHEYHHANPADFISTRQCFGNPDQFIAHYIDGMTLDIAYNILLQIKQEMQYGDSYSPMIIKARDNILSWQYYNGVFIDSTQSIY